MKKNTIKFAGPSKKMMDALEAEGLNVYWPKEVKDREDLAIEALFYTGSDWEKLVLIDLRDEEDLSTKHDVDAAISTQLDEAYRCFDIDEEMKLCLEGSAEEREARGVPDASRLLEDMQEQDARLKRFAEVADAVCRGMQIPQEEDETEIKLTAKQGRLLIRVLGCAIPAIRNINHFLMDGDTENAVHEIIKRIEKELKNGN